MGRFLIFTGILATIAAVIFMLATFGVFGKDVAAQIIVPFACDEGDTIRTQSRYSSFDNSQSIDYYCVDVEGDEEDVTGIVVGIIVVGFGGLITLGIMMTIGGSMMLVGRASKKLMNTVLSQQGTGAVQPAVIDLRAQNLPGQGQFPLETGAVSQQFFSQTSNTASNNTLAGKLQQLEDARQQGLISQSEYEKARQAILDSMDD